MSQGNLLYAQSGGVTAVINATGGSEGSGDSILSAPCQVPTKPRPSGPAPVPV